LKRKLEDVKEFKIERKVFDDRTLLAIFKLMKKGAIKTVESVVSEGKESLVISAKDNEGKWLAVKIYRIEYVDFKSMWKYLIGDQRFKNLKKDRRTVVFNWCKREFKNLKIAYDAGVSCPKPLVFNENILVTELIGENGKFAPRVIDLILQNPQDAYDMIFDEIEKLFKAGLVHTDLSAYNILIFEKPYLIDLSQAVPLQHQLAKEFLERDIKNINKYFERLGVKTKSGEEMLKELEKK